MISIRPIKPRAINTIDLHSQIRGEMVKLAKEIHADFMKTVKTWENKPIFKTQIRRVRYGTAGEEVTVRVTTDDLVYGFVNNGTPPHWIEVVQAEKLRFHEDYIPKTYTWLLESLPGGESGDNVYLEGVWHPGVEPRKFVEKITEKWDIEFPRRLSREFNTLARVTGHSLIR